MTNTTKLALTLYIIAIIALIIITGLIIWRLIIMPPCTKIGNACIIEPWSVAGLAATIMGVAGTILAVFGAIAVASWWTGLDKRIRSQITNLYIEQREETENRITLLNDSITQLKEKTELVEDTMFDGLITIDTLSLEAWAENVWRKKTLPHLALKMAHSYLDSIQFSLPLSQNELEKYKQQDKQIANTMGGEYIEAFSDLRHSLEQTLKKEPTITRYELAKEWLSRVHAEENEETYEQIESLFKKYQSQISSLTREYEKLREKANSYYVPPGMTF